jgi:uncharacterized membrane protein
VKSPAKGWVKSPPRDNASDNSSYITGTELFVDSGDVMIVVATMSLSGITVQAQSKPTRNVVVRPVVIVRPSVHFIDRFTHAHLHGMIEAERSLKSVKAR